MKRPVDTVWNFESPHHRNQNQRRRCRCNGCQHTLRRRFRCRSKASEAGPAAEVSEAAAGRDPLGRWDCRIVAHEEVQVLGEDGQPWEEEDGWCGWADDDPIASRR